MLSVRNCQILTNFRFWNKTCRLSNSQTILVCFSSQTNMSNKWSNPKEIKIPVAYGFIAAKAWGNKSAEPVLALHGWQDNAGTFDKLIPKLSSDLYVVALDAPGHGLSSHKPKGTFYHYMEVVVDIQRVVEYLEWDKFSIIGHSLGGSLGLLYSSLFPDKVKHLVLLDVVKPTSRRVDELPDDLRKGIEGLLEIEKKTILPAPVYNLEEATTRLVEGIQSQITEESAKVLLIRGTKLSECGKGVIFSRDIRVKMTEDLQKLSNKDLKAFLSKLRCNLLMILGNNSYIYLALSQDTIDEYLNLYQETCQTFKVIKVEGNHFVHLNNPDLVAPHIDVFFKDHNILSKL